jgi:CPA2 family monovalent cation:H+ antiporter-2
LHHGPGFLVTALLLAGISLLVVTFFQRLRLPAAAGFIVSGIVIGPAGFGLMRDPGDLAILAELGVTLLLFTVGLEFSLADLRRLGKAALVGGGLQAIGTALVAALVLGLLGVHPARALFFGLLIALSSTALVFKLLSERGELSAPHGRWSAAVLLFQDLMVIPFAIALPYLVRWHHGGIGTPTTGHAGSPLALLLLAIAFVVAWRAVPWVVRRASRSDSREAFLFGIILVALGSAYLTGLAGLSPALGAFVAGLALASSDLRDQIAADVLPLRDAFASVFFISVGMMVERSVVMSAPLEVLAGGLGMMLVKAVVAVAALRIAGAAWRVAIAAGLTLAQVGEFAFVLAQSQGAADLLGPYGRPLFVASAVVSLLLTPLLVAWAPRWALALDVLIERARPVRSTLPEPGDPVSGEQGAPVSRLMSAHVVIAGYGLNGQNLARVLRAVHVPHLVVDLNPETTALSDRDGTPRLIGDVTQPFILKQAGVLRARVLVLALSDPAATRHACRVARSLAPDLFIIVRTRYVGEIDDLFRLGANQVIPEEFETSIEIFTATLRHLHVPMNVIEAQVRLLREERYSLLRGMKLPSSVIEQLETILQQGTCDTFVVLQHSPAVGRSLGDLDLVDRPPSEAGAAPAKAAQVASARVIALVRAGSAMPAPSPAVELRVGDMLVLAGTHAQMDRTFHRLHPRSEPAAGTEAPAAL